MFNNKRNNYPSIKFDTIFFGNSWYILAIHKNENYEPVRWDFIGNMELKPK
jgi:hypothetical protein